MADLYCRCGKKGTLFVKSRAFPTFSCKCGVIISEPDIQTLKSKHFKRVYDKEEKRWIYVFIK